MQFFSISARRTLRTLPTRSVRLAPLQASRPFSAHARFFIKEDADRSPEELEKHKQDHLKKQEKGEGEWDRNLASHGEESIAADRQSDKVGDHDEHMEDLQKETAGESEKDHPHGKAQ